MTDWVFAATMADLPPDGWREVDIDNTAILVINNKGNVYAIENLCTHDGGTLAEGFVEGDDVVCPRHGAKFCIKTGAVTAPPAYEAIKTFPVKIEDGKIFIALV